MEPRDSRHSRRCVDQFGRFVPRENTASVPRGLSPAIGGCFMKFAFYLARPSRCAKRTNATSSVARRSSTSNIFRTRAPLTPPPPTQSPLPPSSFERTNHTVVTSENSGGQIHFSRRTLDIKGVLLITFTLED